MTEAETVGQRIRRLREERGLSQTELARLTDLDHTAISRIENGRTNPTRRTLRDLARGLKTNPEELFKLAER